jgi:hypothetical protein
MEKPIRFVSVCLCRVSSDGFRKAADIFASMGRFMLIIAGGTMLIGGLAGPVWAESPTVESLQTQIQELQRQLDLLKTQVQQEQARSAEMKPAAAVEKAPPTGPASGEKSLLSTTAVKVTLGGFIEAAGIYRNIYQGSDVNSRWNLGSGGFPLPNNPNFYMHELRGTARQSRLSLLAQGQEDYAALAAYFELDFLGAANSANSQESNSYNPRIRHLYATYDTTDGWHLLAGQAFSLLTMSKKGMVPRQENIPLTIESQYVPGFSWTRNPQVRLTRDFGKALSAGLSLESPQALITAGGLSAASGSTAGNYSVRLANPSNFAYNLSSTNSSNLPSTGLSLDEYPDIIGKMAFDPGFGHYEIYGVGRFFTNRTLFDGRRSNHTTFGWGAGAAVLLPLAPKFLDFQASFLAGRGIGRYGSAQLFDAVVNPITGKLDPISAVQAFAGLVAHPSDRLDMYGYAGFEQASRKDVLAIAGAAGGGGGFGNAAYAPASLLQEGNTSFSSAFAQAAAVEQTTLGFWYSFYKGRYGLMRVGLSDSFTRLRIFNLPNEDMNTVMMSLRFYPF